MMHKAWSSIEEVPYCFSRSSVKFQGHTAKKKSSILTQIGCFRTVTPIRIHWWLWNDAQSLKQHRRGVLLFFKVICQISRSHRTKIRWFWPELCVSGLWLEFWFADGFQMMHKAWSNIEEVPYCFSKSSYKFQGHTRQKKSILTQIGRFRTVTPVRIHWWLWNDAQSLQQYRRGALLFFKVFCQISRSHGTKNRRFWPELSVSGL